MPQTTAVEPDKILRELHDLWEQLGRDQQTAGGVLRACAMTLMVATDSGAGQADADSVRQTNPAIGSESAGCSEDHFSPTMTPPGGAPALASIWAIHWRAASSAFSPSTIASSPETDFTLPAASSVNSITFPCSF